MDSFSVPDGLAPEALSRICVLEGVPLSDLRSCQIVDDEVCVRIMRPNGGSRLVMYPWLVGDRGKAWSATAVTALGRANA
jgi:hypothetical protein